MLSDTGLFLPCALEQSGCETTSKDAYAYIWDNPDNRPISILRTEDDDMAKQKKYQVISGAGTSSNFEICVRREEQPSKILWKIYIHLPHF